MIEIAIAALVVLSIAVFVISRRSVTRADKQGTSGAGSTDGSPKPKSSYNGVTLFEGTYEEYPYVVEGSKDGQATVWVEPPGPVTLPFIASMESGALKVKCAHKDMLPYLNDDTDLKDLFGKGAMYVDIGFNADWLVAVFPGAAVPEGRESVEKICAILLRLDKKCSRD